MVFFLYDHGLGPADVRGLIRPAPGTSFDEPAPDAPPTQIEREAAAVYDEIERPRAFPIPKGKDDASS